MIFPFIKDVSERYKNSLGVCSAHFLKEFFYYYQTRSNGGSDFLHCFCPDELWRTRIRTHHVMLCICVHHSLYRAFLTQRKPSRVNFPYLYFSLKWSVKRSIFEFRVAHDAEVTLRMFTVDGNVILDIQCWFFFFKVPFHCSWIQIWLQPLNCRLNWPVEHINIAVSAALSCDVYYLKKPAWFLHN